MSQNDKLKDIKNLFQEFYYYSRRKTLENTFFMGIQTLKYPTDLWVLQEIIFETKPDVIIETGTYNGGSALYMAMLCDHLNNGEVITIDVKEHSNRPKHSRIHYLTGSSVSDKIVEDVKTRVDGKKNRLVILDSEHMKSHVLKELELYSPFVNVGSYLIVEDTVVNGHPVMPEFGPGPYEAVEEFLKNHQEFIVDESKEKFFLTQNPNGFLKRIN